MYPSRPGLIPWDFQLRGVPVAFCCFGPKRNPIRKRTRREPHLTREQTDLATSGRLQCDCNSRCRCDVHAFVKTADLSCMQAEVQAGRTQSLSALKPTERFHETKSCVRLQWARIRRQYLDCPCTESDPACVISCEPETRLPFFMETYAEYTSTLS
jgi:hypothetical protein